MRSRLLSLLLLSLLLSTMLGALPGCGPLSQARGPALSATPAAESAAKSEAPATAPPGGAPGPDGSVAGDQAGSEESGSAATPSPSGADRKLITTASLEVEVISLDEALTALKQLVDKSGGFFAGKTVTQEEGWRSAQVTIRVPADHFAALHEGAVGLGTVKHDEQQAEDVTRQWQDLEARLRIRKQEEQSLLNLLSKQARLSDLLDVEKRLWEVREQIEVSEGELRYLRDQVALATLTVNLHEQVPVGVGKLGRWNLGYHFLRACYALGTAFRGLIVGLEYVLIAGAVVWVPLLLVVLWVRARLRRALGARHAPGPPAGSGR